jgi:hypothetical protein
MHIVSTLFILFSFSSFAKIPHPTCPIFGKMMKEMEFFIKQEGLKISYGVEHDWDNIECGTTKKEWFKNKEIKGTFCAKDRVIVLRKGNPEVYITLLHELKHYKDDKLLYRNANGGTIYDERERLSREKALTVGVLVEYVMIDLWGEARSFQLNIACGDKEKYHHKSVLRNLKTTYLPGYGLDIDDATLKEIYYLAIETKDFVGFVTNSKVKEIYERLVGDYY